ncbi:MAG: hypothetical protein RMM06_09175 [Armatimonadota bacterium]|nr:hypothetical protein [bacterium]MCS7309652.1 hypothetical protein [Armatimonadota bacterium]MDW8104171.1 hypothetical protein [Armatimonadota bacterium]MDW8290884.1 hypothetical protein [Armatimonadota bacterium]
MTRRWTLWTGILLWALGAVVAVAQPPPGAGGFQMTPEMQRQMEAWRKWREAHEHTFRLTSTLRALEEIDRDPKTKLTPAQAKKILDVLQPYRNKPKMTQDDAKNALKGIKSALNVTQLNAIARIEAERRNRRGGFGGPGGGPGGGGMGMRPGGPGGGGMGMRPGGPGGAPAGGGGAGGGFRAFDPARMKDFNPFKPDTSTPWGQRAAERWNAFFKGLQQRASSK